MSELKTKKKTSEDGKGMRFSTKGLDFIITGSIFLVFFLIPFFFTGLVASGLGFEKMVLFYFLVLVGIVAWVTKGVLDGELTLKRTPLDIPILATLVIFTISAFFSISKKDSLIGAYGSSSKGLAALAIFILFYYLVVNNLDKRKIKLFFLGLAFSGSIVAVYSLLQLRGIFILPMPFTKVQSFNPLGSLSALTMFLVASLPVFVVAATQMREIFPKAKKALVLAAKTYFGLVTLVSLVVLALLSGFTFWPIAIVGIVIVLMFFLAKVIKTSGNNLLIPLFSFLILIIFLVLGNFNFADNTLPSEISLSREASWNIAKNSLKENPVLGSGPSTFYYNFSKFKSETFNTTALWNIRFDSATGVFFGLLATVGILGALSVLVAALIALSVSFLTLIKSDDRELNSILLGVFASFISILLFAALFSFNNSLILTGVLVGVFTVSLALFLYPERFKDLKLSFRSSAKYALALSAIFLTVSAGVVVLFTMGLKMYIADVYAREAVVESDPAEKIKHYDKAISMAPFQDVYYIGVANQYMAMANQLTLRGGNQAEIGEHLRLAIDRAKKAVEISDNKASNNESLALIYENASFYTRGALDWAETHYQKLIELDPRNPVPYLRLALVNMARANAESDPEEKKYYWNEAVKKYDEALNKKGDLAAAYYGKAVAYEKLEDVDNAIEELKKANLVSTNNLDYRFELGRLFFNRGASQPNLNQTATREIAESDINPESEEGEGGEGEGEEGEGEEISVQPTASTGPVVQTNTDLRTAEQLFLSILNSNPNHANSLYSLTVLYQKTGENDKARQALNRLLEVVDENVASQLREQFSDFL